MHHQFLVWAKITLELSLLVDERLHHLVAFLDEKVDRSY